MIKPYYSEPNITIYNEDCLNVMKELPDKSIDLILTDPPFKFIHRGGGIYKKRGTLERINKSFGNDFTPTEFLNSIKTKLKRKMI